MTFIFGSWTLGAALLYSAIKNISLLQLVKGEPGQGQPSSIVEGVFAKAAARTVTPKTSAEGVSGPVATSARGLSTWTNPDGSKVKIAKWIFFELKRVGWHGFIESGFRDNQEQAEACAHTSGPCAAPGESNHQGKVFPKGAIDVRQSETAALDRKLKANHSPLVYAGAKDPVHFSHPHDGSY